MEQMSSVVMGGDGVQDDEGGMMKVGERQRERGKLLLVGGKRVTHGPPNPETSLSQISWPGSAIRTAGLRDISCHGILY